MKPFQQPVLENDRNQLESRLKYAEYALWSWRKNKDCKYGEEFIEKNKIFFSEQVKNIKAKLEVV